MLLFEEFRPNVGFLAAHETWPIIWFQLDNFLDDSSVIVWLVAVSYWVEPMRFTDVCSPQCRTLLSF